MGGFKKLTAANASTATFGNVGVMGAVDWLSERAAAAFTDASIAATGSAAEIITARLFMGR
jgi:hypothetical protein